MLIQNQKVIMVTMAFMVITRINIMLTNILMKHMNIKSKFVYIFLIFITGCSFSPGMYMDTNSTWLTEKNMSIFLQLIRI